MSRHIPWHRSTRNKVLAGVCSGLAESWGTDPNLLRLLWVLFALYTHSLGLFLYLLAALILPAEDKAEKAETEQKQWGGDWLQERRVRRWIGIFLVLAGGYWMLESFLPDVVAQVRRVGLPLLLIAVGLWLVLRDYYGREEGE